MMELKEDRSLLARMLVVCKSRPEINLEESIVSMNFLLSQELCLLLIEQCYTVQSSKLMSIFEKFPLDEAATLDQTDDAADTSIFFTKHRDSCRI